MPFMYDRTSIASAYYAQQMVEKMKATGYAMLATRWPYGGVITLHARRCESKYSLRAGAYLWATVDMEGDTGIVRDRFTGKKKIYLPPDRATPDNIRRILAHLDWEALHEAARAQRALDLMEYIDGKGLAQEELEAIRKRHPDLPDAYCDMDREHMNAWREIFSALNDRKGE